MLELFAIMESLADFLKSGAEVNLANVIREVRLPYFEKTTRLYKNGMFTIDGQLNGQVDFSLTGLPWRRRQLLIWFKNEVPIIGRAADLIPDVNKKVFPSPVDEGYLVSYDLKGFEASFLIEGTSGNISLMACKDLETPLRSRPLRAPRG